MARWRLAAYYEPLLGLDRFGWAWEWLRRNECFAAEARAALKEGSTAASGAVSWGLHQYVDPNLPAPDARPMWHEQHCPYVLKLACDPGGPDPFDPRRFGPMLTLIDGPGRQHGLVSDGWRSVRLDVVEGRLSGGPVTFSYLLSGIGCVDAPLLVLRRFLQVARTGSLAGPLFVPYRLSGRQMLMLRAFDGWRFGASQREIARQLLDVEAGEARWRTELPSVRSRVQRLIRNARRMSEVGYRELLGGSSDRRAEARRSAAVLLPPLPKAR